MGKQEKLTTGTCQTCDGFNSRQDAARVVAGSLTWWPRISLRKLSREIDLRHVVIEQATDEITVDFIPSFHRLQSRSIPASVQYCRWFQDFVREWNYVLDNLLLLKKHVSTSVDTLAVKTVECGVRKLHIHSFKLLCISQEFNSFSITNWVKIVP